MASTKKDFIPSKDADLVAWQANMGSLITAHPSDFGLSAPIATQFTTLGGSFAAAYTLAHDPSTRTKGTVAARRLARKTFVAYARQVARIVQSTPTVTPEQKIDLGLNPHDTVPSPINPPTDAPVLEIVSAFGRTIRVKLHGVGTDRRGKPAGVAGAAVYSYVGATPPSDPRAYTAEGSTTRASFDVTFPATVPAGSQVWLTAYWFNPRQQSGPACTPVSAYVAGGVAMAG